MEKFLNKNGKRSVVSGTILIKMESCISNTIFDGYLITNSGAMAESAWVKQDGQWYYALASGKLIKTSGTKLVVPGTTLTKMLLWQVTMAR